MKSSFLFFLTCVVCLSMAAQEVPLYVGTFTDSSSEGIYIYNFNTETGKLSNQTLAVKADGPSFIAFSTDKKRMYAVTNDKKNGFVNAYNLRKDGTLEFINKVSSNGSGPCHVELNEKSDKVVVSNYGGGTISVYGINPDGSVKEASQVFDHNIEGKKSHAHSAKFLENNLFVADLGRDFLAHYVENNGEFNLQENYMMEDKAGPRHFDISNKGKYIFVINELNSSVSVLKKEDNSYTNIQDISTLKDDFDGKSYCADIHLSKNEQFLYGSNRGENSIVVYKRDQSTGLLEKIQSISTHGDWPRNFTLGPNGKFLLVANQKSKNVSVYNVDKKTGKLTFIYSKDMPTPVCLLF